MLISSYKDVYVKKFPSLGIKIQQCIAFKEQIKSKKDISFDQLFKYFSKKELYKEIKSFLMADPSEFYLKLIRKLGGFYRFKSYLLYFKMKGKL